MLGRPPIAISGRGVATQHHLVLPPHSSMRGGGRSASAEVAEVTDTYPRHGSPTPPAAFAIVHSLITVSLITMPAIPPGSKVLVTGASGYIAA